MMDFIYMHIFYLETEREKVDLKAYYSPKPMELRETINFIEKQVNYQHSSQTFT